MVQQQQSFQARKKLLINDLYRGQLKSETIPDGSKYPATAFFELANNGRIFFKVNDGNYDPKNKNKEVELCADDRNSIFNLIKLAATSKDFETASYEVMDRKFIFAGGQSKLSENPINLATFTIAKDKRGVIILLYVKGDYKQKFSFTQPNHSKLMIKKDGEMVHNYELLSSIYATAWCDRLSVYLNKLEEDNYVPPKPKEGSNNYSKSSGGSSMPDTSFDDDFDINF